MDGNFRRHPLSGDWPPQPKLSIHRVLTTKSLRTVGFALEQALDELRRPPHRDFLVHRIVGLVATMRDYGDDELFPALLNRLRTEGAGRLTTLEVASLGVKARKLFTDDGHRCLLQHHFGQSLAGEVTAADLRHSISASPS